jgi:hypothetical protein
MAERLRMTGSAAAVAILLLGASPALAQDDPFGGPRGGAWGPALDSVAVGADTRAVWRGFELGGPGIDAVIDVAIWGRPVTAAGDWGLSLRALGLLVPDAHPGAVIEDRVSADLDLVRRLGSRGATLHLVAGGYHLPDASEDETGAEVGARLQGVEIPWSGEVRPTLDFTALHDPVHFEGTHVEAGFGYFPGLLRVGLWIDARAWWNDYGDRDLQFQGWRAGAGVSLDAIPLGDRWIVLAVGGGAVEPDDSPVLGWGRVRVTLK